jgi:16S rRNA (cytosine967-C5)-methyltransferase
VTPPARLAAAAGLLDRIVAGEPAERVLTTWGRASRFAGSKDRAAVRDAVFDALRRRRSLAWLGGADTGRGLVIGALRSAGTDPATLMTGEGHALVPPGPDESGRPLGRHPRPSASTCPTGSCRASPPRSGTTSRRSALRSDAARPSSLRANLRRTDRNGALAALAADGIVGRLHPHVRTAVEVLGNVGKVTASKPYVEGLVEIQDASSQAAVLRLPLRDDASVLDLCAGGGGKTLAMGALADLRLVAHDEAPARMRDLPVRAARAGLAVTLADDPAARAPHDLVLVDAPCSGSGTWRRAPEAKWRLTPERLADLVALQGALLDQGADLVRPGGHLAFATCSVLDEEGPAPVAAFLARRPGFAAVDVLRFLPGPDGDGFFQAVLRRGPPGTAVAPGALAEDAGPGVFTFR